MCVVHSIIYIYIVYIPIPTDSPLSPSGGTCTCTWRTHEPPQPATTAALRGSSGATRYHVLGDLGKMVGKITRRWHTQNGDMTLFLSFRLNPFTLKQREFLTFLDKLHVWRRKVVPQSGGLHSGPLGSVKRGLIWCWKQQDRRGKSWSLWF